MSALRLPELFHIGWVVRDCAAAQEELSSSLGVGPFRVVEQARFDHALVHGAPTAFSLKIAFGALGDSLVELLEPLDDRSPHAEFLARRGEGIHHLAYLIEDFDDQLKRAREMSGDRGLLVDGSGPNNAVRWAYMEAEGSHGAVVELLERSATSDSVFRDVLALVGR